MRPPGPPSPWAAHFGPPGGVWTDENARLHLAALRAARERAGEYGRLYTRRGSRAHLVPPWARGKDVLCSVLPSRPGEWLGTGSQDEYDLAGELETCKRGRTEFIRSVRCGNPECICQKTISLGIPPGPP